MRSFPVNDSSVDMICAFSVFTHLLPEEVYIYLEDAQRVLKAGGRVVLSFLEFTAPSHWKQFQSAVDALKINAPSHLNTFLAREAIETFAVHLGFDCEAFITGDQAPWDGAPLGQSVAILCKKLGLDGTAAAEGG